MEIWKSVQQHLPDWLLTRIGLNNAAEATLETPESAVKSGDTHLQLATESLRQLLDDVRIPDSIRQTLSDDYAQVRSMLDKLEHGHLHIAVFGRVSVGKSSLLNALLGKTAFAAARAAGN